MLQHYPGVKMQVTPNGVDLDRFCPRLSVRKELRTEQNVGDATVALFVGGDWDRKGLDIAIEAIARLQADGRDVRLWVVGNGDCGRFNELAKVHNVDSCVCFFGRRSDAERFYNAADVLVFPTSYEAFSLVTLEAAASGLPAIISRVNGTSELVGNNEAGLLVERTVDSIVATLIRLVDDTELRSLLGRQARERAMQYGWDDSIGAVTQLYTSLLPDKICSSSDDGGE
jgi:glycosyltransferase involved in cell wall biosynthesis